MVKDQLEKGILAKIRLFGLKCRWVVVLQRWSQQLAQNLKSVAVENPIGRRKRKVHSIVERFV